MCGFICGESINEIKENEITDALAKIYHRGPDGNNVFSLNDRLFLAHARLSIVGVENGEQPLWNGNGTIVAVVNGEFYDHTIHKKMLKQKGYRFKTNSDSEILLYLYEEFGVNCLKFLNGEFAFALYDFIKKEWFCARDRMGVRPIHFYKDSESFFVASEAKSLMCISQVKQNISFNMEGFWFSQHLQYLPQDETLYKNINMIKPGHYIIVSENNKIIQKEYWSLRNIKKRENVSFNEAKSKVKKLLTDAVRKRIPDEVRWATHLSGGIDSSIVTAISSRYAKERATAFSVSFVDDKFYDEINVARETADFLGVNLITVPVSFEDMVKAIPDAVTSAEGMSINGHIGAKYLLNKAIHDQGFKVALSGEGSDEIFMGYSHLKQDYLSENSLKSMEKAYLSGIQLPSENMLDLSAISGEIGFVPTWIKAKASMAHKFKEVWHNDFMMNQRTPYKEIVKDLTGFSSNLKASSASWSQYCLSGYILKVLDDAQSMAHSIEGRLPFLDVDLMEYVFSLPENIYFKGDIEKGLLREGFKQDLPRSVIEKTKQSFMSPPMNRFIKNKTFIELLNEYIFDNEKLKSLNIYNLEKLHKMIMSDNDRVEFEPIIMTVLSVGINIKKGF